ncbi:MAG: (2Fe-2S)-binding protein [Rhodococcus sp. (in: high G+C Gram-positive bacteria)]
MSVYYIAAERVEGLREYVSGPFELPASVMRDVHWMRARVSDTGRRWHCTDGRVNGTLWWYSASSTLAFLAIATAMVTGEAADPRLDGARCSLRPDGYLGGTVSDRVVPVAELPAALNEAFTEIVDALAPASGARKQALWAIASDSIANRSLDVGAALGDRSVGSDFASWLIGAMPSTLPAPRFVDVGGRRFTQRSSCCLIYETGDADKCTSCPRRTPADRLRGLEIAARY